MPSLKRSGSEKRLLSQLPGRFWPPCSIAPSLPIEDLLISFGCSVAGPVARVQKAIEMAEGGALDLAILDVNINGREVYPVAEALARRGIPFIFVTGYGRSGIRAAYHDRPILPKPFRRDELRLAIERLASGPG